MTEEEMRGLARLLADDDFAKDLTLGISPEKTGMLDQLRALRPWRDERYSNSDIGNGYLFADYYKDTARFVSERKCWYVYDGQAWRADLGGLRAMEKCKELAMLLFLLTAEITDKTLREICINRASHWHNRSVRETVLKDASSVYCLRMADFDRDPYLFNCLNGTLDLRSGTFREHRPDDLLTMISGVSYDPDARCERWERFMDEIMSGPDVGATASKVAYFQKAFGYALTGNTRHECLFILYGATTRNGKGTAMETFLRLMGDYGKTARPETIGTKFQQNSNGPSEDIARLNGARFVNISEPDKKLTLSARRSPATIPSPPGSCTRTASSSAHSSRCSLIRTTFLRSPT